MAIRGIISATDVRRWVKNSRRARTAGAGAGAASCASRLRERSSRFAGPDFNERQLRITAILSERDLDLNIWPVAGAVGHRFGQRFPTVRFFRRSESQRAVRAAGVVPIRKSLKPALDSADRRGHEREPLPKFECPEKPLNFAVQKWRSHACANLADFALAQGLAELFAELRAVVGDEELGRAVFSRRGAYQGGHVAGAWCSGINLQCQRALKTSQSGALQNQPL